MKEIVLTPKQEKFAQLYLELGDASKAYRGAYSVGADTKDETVWNSGYKVLENPKVKARIAELQKNNLKKFEYTLEKSVKRDIALIEKYERALSVIDNPLAEEKELSRATMIIRAIGVSGYGNAQDRLSKQHGFYERDNKQKVLPSFNIFDARGIKVDELKDEDDDE